MEVKQLLQPCLELEETPNVLLHAMPLLFDCLKVWRSFGELSKVELEVEILHLIRSWPCIAPWRYNYTDTEREEQKASRNKEWLDIFILILN
ncbi:hypothetical protein ACFX2J_001656 [Malus domestica]